MSKHFFVLALRNLRRHKGYAAINLASLAVGVVVGLFALLFARHEWSFDRHFDDAGRIYRVVTEERSTGRVERTALTASELAPVLQEERPDVAVTRLYRWPYEDILVTRNERRIKEPRFFRVDSTFLDVFALGWVAGDPGTALSEPYTVVLAESAAARYFERGDALGGVLRVGGQRDYVVTGVVQDVPPNTHVQFDFLAFNGRGFPDGWGEKHVWTYVKLPPEAAPSTLAQLLGGVVKRHAPAHLHGALSLSLQPLTDIHLDAHLSGEARPGGNRRALAAFGLVGLSFVLIGCVNYVNLATARAAQRSREIGVRKALGSSRSQVTAQMIGEAVLMATAAVGLALVLVVALRPAINAAFGVVLPPLRWTDGAMWAALAALTLGVGGLSGGYPALYLASLHPARVLRGDPPRPASAIRLREGLVVFQLVALLVLLIGTFVVERQVRYMLADERGVDRADVLLLSVPREVAVRWGWDPTVLREELLRRPRVRDASAVHVPWGPGLEQYRVQAAGVAEASQVGADVLWVSDDRYTDLYGVTVLEGAPRLQQWTDSTALEVVINETAAQRLGLEHPVGSAIDIALGEGEWQRGRVVGVVEDFHYRTLHHAIQPLMFVRGIGFSSMAVRIDARERAEAVADVAAVWQRLAPEHPFEYAFLDDRYREEYWAEERVARVAGTFAGLSLLIACLGLLGLVGFMTQIRKKEIGVRKVLGASVSSLVVLLSKGFAGLVGVALVVAVPLSLLAAERWLSRFPYRVEVGADVFAVAGGLVLAITLATVSVHTLRAATADPVRALRSE